MKYLLVAILLLFSQGVPAATKSKSSRSKPLSSKVIGVLVNKAKIPKTESAYMEIFLQHRWTVHKKGLQLTDAPKDSLVFDIGIRIGDILVAVNNLPMNKAKAIFDGVNSVREENKCNLLVYRDDGMIEFSVTAK